MGMDLRKLGFKTGKVVLPGLGLETRLEPGQYFRNDGVVKDLRRYWDTLSKQFNFPDGASWSSGYTLSDAAGVTLECDLDKDTSNAQGQAIIVAVQDKGYLENIFSLGHELLHAYMRLAEKNKKQKEHQKEFTAYINFLGFNIDPFKVFDDEEHVAHISGLVSMHRRGRDDYYRMPVPDFVVEAFLDSRNKKITGVYR
jgi:hypothetical protein